MPEQFAFQQAGGDRRAVHFDETALAAAAQFVNCPGDQFSPSACFARYENGRIRPRHGLNTLQNGLKSRPPTHHVPDIVVEADLVFEVDLLDCEPLLDL